MSWRGMGFKSYQEYLQSYLWKNKRDWIIKTMGSGGCQKCGTYNYLEVHHLNYKNVGSESSEDVIVLCHKCHMKEHKNV